MKILAAILVISGAFGYGNVLLKEQRIIIDEYEKQEQILIEIQQEIKFFVRNIPDALKCVAQKQENTYKIFLENIWKKMKDMDGRTFSQIWNEEIEKINIAKNHKIIKVMQDFPQYIQCTTEEMQIQGIQYMREKLEEEIIRRKNKYEKNKQCILWGSTMTGVLCIILFV